MSNRSAATAWLSSSLIVLMIVAVVPPTASGHPGIHEQEATADAALKAEPSDPEAHITRGKLYQEVENWDAAIAAFSRARDLGAPVQRAATLVGNVYLAAGWTLTAKRYFDEAIEVQSDYVSARIGRARVQMLQGDPAAAESDFAVAFPDIAKPSPALVLERHRALRAAGQSDKALVFLEGHLARMGPVPALQSAAVDLELEAGKFDAALQRVDALLGQAPRHPIWAAKRAEILEHAGRTDEARAAYREALAFVQLRTSRRGSRNLEDLEKQLHAALERGAEKNTEKGEQ